MYLIPTAVRPASNNRRTILWSVRLAILYVAYLSGVFSDRRHYYSGSLALSVFVSDVAGARSTRNYLYCFDMSRSQIHKLVGLRMISNRPSLFSFHSSPLNIPLLSSFRNEDLNISGLQKDISEINGAFRCNFGSLYSRKRIVFIVILLSMVLFLCRLLNVLNVFIQLSTAGTT